MIEDSKIYKIIQKYKKYEINININLINKNKEIEIK